MVYDEWNSVCRLFMTLISTGFIYSIDGWIDGSFRVASIH